jgi:hypothetical protein
MKKSIKMKIPGAWSPRPLKKHCRDAGRFSELDDVRAELESTRSKRIKSLRSELQAMHGMMSLVRDRINIIVEEIEALESGGGGGARV